MQYIIINNPYILYITIYYIHIIHNLNLTMLIGSKLKFLIASIAPGHKVADILKNVLKMILTAGNVYIG